ncbi:hypothetical protein CBM2609_A70016 [Cupriavidus taiwanensis]|nr:hypothetical protein CBM2604_A60016 [Cupriavidus taiwanensis]SOZ28723.1 hypothetical protein CBM2609_A70016 [Cupriavidus taiwanensis]SOZ46184.1 hypothetical protein CBM2610_A70452 [Cupriavidus taiwanensis]
MIDAGQADHRFVRLAEFLRHLADAPVELEQHRALAVVAHHALDPEERRHPRPARDWCHMVDAGGRVQHHVPGRQFHALLPVGVLDHQFAAVVVFRLGQEQRRRQVAADAEAGAAQVADRVVDMVGKGMPALIAVEQRRINLQRQCRREEQCMVAQRVLDQVADLPRRRRALGQLQVALGQCRLVARGFVAVGPGCRVDDLAHLRDLGLGQYVGDLQHHDGFYVGINRQAPIVWEARTGHEQESLLFDPGQAAPSLQWFGYAVIDKEQTCPNRYTTKRWSISTWNASRPFRSAPSMAPTSAANSMR